MKPRVKRILRVSAWVLSILFILILLLWLVTYLINRQEYRKPDTSGWQTGYLFFSVGDSWKSNAVRTMTGTKYGALSDSTPSHCGIVLMNPEGPLLVHESTDEGKVVAETPEQYLKKNGAYCVYAVPVPYNIDTVMLRKDVEQMLRAGVPFDYDFNHRESSKLYCTEFVVTVLEKNGVTEVSKLRELKYIYPADLLHLLRR